MAGSQEYDQGYSQDFYQAVKIDKHGESRSSSTRVPEGAPLAPEGAIQGIYEVNSEKYYAQNAQGQLARYSGSGKKWVSSDAKGVRRALKGKATAEAPHEASSSAYTQGAGDNSQESLSSSGSHSSDYSAVSRGERGYEQSSQPVPENAPAPPSDATLAVYDVEAQQYYVERQNRVERYSQRTHEWASSRAKGMREVLQTYGVALVKVGVNSLPTIATGIAKYAGGQGSMAEQYGNYAAGGIQATQAAVSFGQNLQRGVMGAGTNSTRPRHSQTVFRVLPQSPTSPVPRLLSSIPSSPVLPMLLVPAPPWRRRLGRGPMKSTWRSEGRNRNRNRNGGGYKRT